MGGIIAMEALHTHTSMWGAAMHMIANFCALFFKQMIVGISAYVITTNASSCRYVANLKHRSMVAVELCALGVNTAVAVMLLAFQLLQLLLLLVCLAIGIRVFGPAVAARSVVSPEWAAPSSAELVHTVVGSSGNSSAS